MNNADIFKSNNKSTKTQLTPYTQSQDQYDQSCDNLPPSEAKGSSH